MTRKSVIFVSLLLLILISSTAIVGCSYITGEALNETRSVPPRWGWTLIDNTYPTTIIDRTTRELLRDASPTEVFGIMGTSSYLGNPIVVDVRAPQEYAEGHIWQATNIAYQSPNFSEEISKLNKNFTIIVYCQSGYRSNLARKVMEDMGFKYVINMTGGFSAWVAAGLPVDY
jgi:phage shock protein E